MGSHIGNKKLRAVPTLASDNGADDQRNLQRQGSTVVECIVSLRRRSAGLLPVPTFVLCLL